MVEIPNNLIYMHRLFGMNKLQKVVEIEYLTLNQTLCTDIGRITRYELIWLIRYFNKKNKTIINFLFLKFLLP